jgi:hypothetical protein
LTRFLALALFAQTPLPCRLTYLVDDNWDQHAYPITDSAQCMRARKKQLPINGPKPISYQFPINGPKPISYQYQFIHTLRNVN